jgi:hypothetical protein
VENIGSKYCWDCSPTISAAIRTSVMLPVMRLAGTHNTKQGAWTLVQDHPLRYELEDWLTVVSPTLHRRPKLMRRMTPSSILGSPSPTGSACRWHTH